MKKTLFFLFWMVPLYMMAQQAMTSSQAEWLVKRYYDAYSTIARNHGKGDVSEQTQQSLYQYCINGVEFTVANEFYEMKGLGTMKHAGLRSFSNFFLDLSKGSMDFSYELVGKPELRQKIADDKKDTGAIFAMVRVKKKYVLDGKIWEYTDTVGVDMRKGRICSVNNSVYPFIQAMQDATSEQLQAEALKEYSHKNYNLAFSLLQEALKKDPTDADVSYQLGVMTYKGQGCRQYKKKVRDYMTEFYWLKSSKGRSRLSDENVYSIDYISGLANCYRDLFDAYSGYENNPFLCNRLLAYDRKNARFGFINNEGKMVVPQKYKFALPFMDNGTTVVQDENNNIFLIDTVGKIINLFSGYHYYKRNNYNRNDWCDTQRYIKIRINDAWGCMDRISGEWTLPVSRGADSIFDICFQTPVAYRYKENGKCGLKSLNGEEILAATHKNITMLTYHERDEDGNLKITTMGYECTCVRVLYDYDEDELKKLQRKSRTGEVSESELTKIGTVMEVKKIPGKWEQPVEIVYTIPFTYKTDTSFEKTVPVLCVVKPKFEEEIRPGGNLGLRKMRKEFRLWGIGICMFTVDDYWKESGSEILPCEYKNISTINYISDTTGQPVALRILVNYDTDAFEKIKKEYSSVAKATDAELKKIGTLIKVKINLLDNNDN